QLARLRKSIAELPIKVIVHLKQRFDASWLINDVVLETFSAKMHMREETEQCRIVWERTPRLDAVVVGLRRNGEVIVGQLQRQDALGRQLFCEDQADRRLIAVRTAVRRVVHLKYKVGSGRNEFSQAVGPLVRRASGCIDKKHIAVGPVSFVLQLRVGEA